MLTERMLDRCGFSPSKQPWNGFASAAGQQNSVLVGRSFAEALAVKHLASNANTGQKQLASGEKSEIRTS